MDTIEYHNRLRSNTQEFLNILRSCSDEELHFKPEGKWSILEIAEHILISERVVNIILYKSTESRSGKLENLGFDKLNRIVVGLRSRKIEAPENFKPKGKLKNVAEFETTLNTMRYSLWNNIESGRLIIDDKVFKHPVLGEMTVTDWLYFIPLHASRHMDQIRDTLTQIRTGN